MDCLALSYLYLFLKKAFLWSSSRNMDILIEVCNVKQGNGQFMSKEWGIRILEGCVWKTRSS